MFNASLDHYDECLFGAPISPKLGIARMPNLIETLCAFRLNSAKFSFQKFDQQCPHAHFVMTHFFESTGVKS